MNHPTQLPVTPAAPQRWAVELAWRIRYHLLLKSVGITAFTWLFFIAYFHLLRHPAHAITVMPLTALDRAIAFEPQALPAYVSLWLYVGIAPGLQRSVRALIVYGLWIGALCLSGLGLFYVWPTAVPATTLDVSGWPGFALLQGVDASGNACPSMHVAVAIFSALWIESLLRTVGAPGALRWLNAAWFVAIAYSTLAIKQHVVIDVVTGALLGGAFAWASLRSSPRTPRPDQP
jgi:membrane-associated phospholipid phosphatase